MKQSFILLFLVHLLFIGTAWGQYAPPKVPEKYCKALDETVLSAAAGSTAKSIAEIEELIQKYPTWTEPRHHLSRILYEGGRKPEALKVMEHSIAIDTNSQLAQLYTLGRLYEEVDQYDKAIIVYKTIIQKGVNQQGLAQRANASLKALEEKRELFKNNYSITLSPLHEGINSKEHEALGRWTIDGMAIIFTRYIDPQEDLFIGRFDDTGKLLTVDPFTFSSEFNEGGHAISPDGKYLIFTSCDRPDIMGSCDLYLSVLKEGKWTKPDNMGPAFNSVSWDSQPAFGLDGTSIWFTSTRPGGFGGSDIWYIRELAMGKWSKPINAGPQINTTNNEESPFIYFDGRTIYFMRDGKTGLGGFDLYFSQMNIDGNWNAAKNMGAPINTSSDEGALSIHPDGRKAMITRVTEKGKNDLFEFELPAEFQSPPVQALHVIVTDANTNKPIRARLELFDVSKKDTIRVSQWSDEKGNITTTLERNKSYGIIASAENYLMHSSNISADSSLVRILEIKLTPLTDAIDKTVVLENIFFATGSAILLPASDPELNKLLWVLRNNANMHIEIGGHTDNVGTDVDNQFLSKTRAKAVYQYLIDRGINSARLSFKGFGEMKPVAENETESGRKKNRRTEFIITRI